MMILTRKNNIYWITSTAIFIALLVVAQVVTSAFGNTLVTGSVNNLLMILSVMLLGLSSGVTVAVLSPIIAKLIGIGPLWSLIPFIIAGNLVLVLLWHFIGNRRIGKAYLAHILALVVAAVAKFLVLYISIVRIAVPFLLGLPEKQAAVISGMFSVSQLFTATIGGVLATLILPVLRKAIKK
jgi:hypothetical protein